MKRRLLLLASFFCFLPLLHSQELNNGIPFRMSIRASGTVPHPVTNKAFRRSFTGIYDVTVNYSYQVFHGFQVGASYEHNLWKTPDNKIPGLNTYAQSHHGGFRVGYDHVISDNGVAYGGISALIGQMHFYGISYRPDSTGQHVPLQKKFTYHTIEADAGAYFYTEGNFAIGMHVAYLFTDFRFDPYKLYLDQHKAYIASDLNGTVSHFNFGFDVVFSFLKMKG